MKRLMIPGSGMRIIKTAVAVAAAYSIFLCLGLVSWADAGGVWGQLSPNDACIACIVCTQSTLGQTKREGLSRFIGVALGGALGVLALFLEPVLNLAPVRVLTVGAVCMVSVWFCLLLHRRAACSMACIVACSILIMGVTSAERFSFAAARIIETAVGVLVAVLVNAALPDHRPEQAVLREETAALQVPLDNATKKLCVIGDPVLHSRSPLIQNTMIKALGLDYIYLCQPVPRGDCARWLELAKYAGYAGFNATMPHKQELLPLMDELDEDARRFGAVNTVCIREGKAYGYNTDGAGFLRALAEAGIDPAGRRIVLLGAGGAAKALALKLSGAGARSVTICNRTLSKAQELCAQDPAGVLHPAGFDRKSLCAAAAQCGLLINCTSLGMDGTAEQFEDFSFLEALPAGTPVCDLIYSPRETELLRRARLLGHKGMNGMGLLIHQAVLSLEHFTGVPVDAGAMKPLIEAALTEKNV